VTSSTKTYFGGPDKNKNLLRDILVEHIHAVPANGNIKWACYYLHDPIIFQALIEAAKRGVTIELTIDGRPRSPDVNQACIDQLSHHSAISINVVKIKLLWENFGIHWHPHLHTKLYFFSHPTPHVLLGSYNPTTGADYLDEGLISSIGDHSISHNVLVSVDDRDTVKYLEQHLHTLKNHKQRKFSRISSTHNSTFRSSTWEINFLPSLSTHPINTLLSKKHSNVNVKCAISHLKGPGILKPLKIAIKTGKKIELLLESSQRRVPIKHLAFLDKHNIKYYQPVLEKHCLMHSKFILYQSDQEHCVMFGSFNWSARSRLLNHEIIACAHNQEIIAAFEQRWHQMIA